MAAVGDEAAQVHCGSLPRRLASVDKKVRDRAVDLLERWLLVRQSIDDADLRKIWKGLFYCFWHSDKAHVQADLAERLSSLLLTLPSELGPRFFGEFLGTMRREWGGIDLLRMNKFYLLQRKFVSAMFKALEKAGWDEQVVCEYMQALKSRSLLADDLFPAQGSSMHFAEVFLEEMMAAVAFPDEAQVFGLLLEPFYAVLALSPDKTFVRRVKESLFDRLREESLKAREGGGEKNRIAEFLLQVPVEKKLFALGSAAETPQGNRKLLFSLHEDFKRLKKNLCKANGDPESENNGDPESENNGDPESENNGDPESKNNGDPVSEKKSKKPASSSTAKLAASTRSAEAEAAQEDSVVSNLESKFEVVAAEENEVGSALPPLEMVLSPLIAGSRRRKAVRKKSSMQQILQSDTPMISSPPAPPELQEISPVEKKRKRDKSAAFRIAVSPLNTASKKRKSSSSSSTKDSPGESESRSSISDKKKKVRFALKKNTVWKPNSPSKFVGPPLASSTPRSSALKQGLSPGPIRSLSPRRISPKNNRNRNKRISKRT